MKSQQLSSFILIAGIALLGLSYAWPAFTTGRGNWSDEQANELLEVRAALHGGAHDHSAGASHTADGADQAELENRLKQLESELELAQSGGGVAVQVLWSLGALLAVVGAALYFVNRDS